MNYISFYGVQINMEKDYILRNSVDKQSVKKIYKIYQRGRGRKT